MSEALQDPSGQWYCGGCGSTTTAGRKDKAGKPFTSKKSVEAHFQYCLKRKMIPDTRHDEVVRGREYQGKSLVEGMSDPADQSSIISIGASPLFDSYSTPGTNASGDYDARLQAIERRMDKQFNATMGMFGELKKATYVKENNDDRHLAFGMTKQQLVLAAIGVVGFIFLMAYLNRQKQLGHIDEEDCDQIYDQLLERSNDLDKASQAKQRCRRDNLKLRQMEGRYSGGSGGALGGILGAFGGAIARKAASKIF